MNSSLPTYIMLAHTTYQNVPEAMPGWPRLSASPSTTVMVSPGGPVSGAQMHLGGAWMMLNSARTGEASPVQVGHSTQFLTVLVEDVDAHYARAKSAGAKIVEELNETCYGERQYGVEDLEGHHWLFSRHARDVSPAEWGATIARR